MTQEQKDALAAHVEKFIADNQIRCSETVFQTDRVAENALDFIDGCAEIVGYAPAGED